MRLHNIIERKHQNIFMNVIKKLVAITMLIYMLGINISVCNAENWFREYKLAKKYYYSKNYEMAKVLFNQLIQREYDPKVFPYALFYYALSMYRIGSVEAALDSFNNILDKYPNWEQIAEIQYWLAQINFEKKQYEAALAYLTSVSNPDLDYINSMKLHFLNELEIDVVGKYYNIYPDDKAIATVLENKIMQQPLICRDLVLLGNIEKKFGLVRLKEKDYAIDILSVKKDSYNIAVFLPFLLETFTDENNTVSKPIFSLYQGIVCGLEILNKKGINVNLYAYDTKKDNDTMIELLQKDEIKNMDIIIGHTYASAMSIISKHAEEQMINVFSPFSEKSDLVGFNPFLFLFNPSLETQAIKAAEYTLQSTDGNIVVGIVHDNTKNSLLKANEYKKYIEKKTGQEVAFYLGIDPDEASTFLKPFIRRNKKKENYRDGSHEPIIDFSKLTHLYVASKNELVVANIISIIKILNSKVCIIGDESWMNHSYFEFEQLNKLNLVMVAPNYIDYNKPNIYAFRNNFYNKFSQLPNLYACIGYEMIIFLGEMLHTYGNNFPKYWKDDDLYSGVLFDGQSYGLHQDNQNVPIISVGISGFTVCNKSSEKEKHMDTALLTQN